VWTWRDVIKYLFTELLLEHKAQSYHKRKFLDKEVRREELVLQYIGKSKMVVLRNCHHNDVRVDRV
jgi:hypothetical protein